MSLISPNTRRLILPTARRLTLPSPSLIAAHQQVRHATLIRRPKRPYTFTQLVTLTDGSTYLHRTTSPSPVYKATKDVRNSPLWNPSSQNLQNIEEDDAGKLRSFRGKFGRGWDGETEQEAVDVAEETQDALSEETGETPKAVKQESLMDLIGTYGSNEQQAMKAKYLHTPASQKKK
ncbi:50S ribosomal protein L36 [Venturia nashicola]|uniref:50S ribosomal protein L36 n=1 Tax=Venturia nashicola TaxID=86259 RepID=A0A4Z1P239_9PEZI|nr:50S ribosomal protein L36 [Venturia nashicola]TLD20162.1 50S ribosomal protein L36 [Venturia nashicola]